MRSQKTDNADYNRVGHLLRTGFIKELDEVFDTGIRKAILQDMKMSYKTLGRRLDDPGTFKVKEIIIIADRLKVERTAILQLVFQAADGMRKKGKKL